MTKDGTVLSCDINGVIQCDCQLSGMPELRMGFNDMLAVNQLPTSKKCFDFYQYF